MQPPQSIEEIKAGLETTEKGGVRQSIRNCLTVFQRDPLLSGAIAYNILTDRKDIIKPIGFHREMCIRDSQYAVLVREFCQQQFVSKGMIADFAIHDPHPPGHNPHAHVLLTMRAMDEHGKWLPKSRKVYDLDENGERIKLPSGRWKKMCIRDRSTGGMADMAKGMKINKSIIEMGKGFSVKRVCMMACLLYTSRCV